MLVLEKRENAIRGGAKAKSVLVERTKVAAKQKPVFFRVNEKEANQVVPNPNPNLKKLLEN